MHSQNVRTRRRVELPGRGVLRRRDRRVLRPIKYLDTFRPLADAGRMPDPSLRTIFDADAELYDRARPDYPAPLLTDLVALTRIGRGSRVIEIGPGTGQATRDLARTGAKITAVELGPQLAAVLQTNLPEIEVVNAGFEEWTPPAPVDLVASFTAWHWIDRSVRAQRVHAALRPGGHLATVTTEHVRGGTVEFFERAQECYLHWDPATDRAERLVTPDDLPPITDEIDDSPLFVRPQRRRYVRHLTYSTDQYLAVLQTYSGHRALDPERRQGLLDCLRSLLDDRFGGQITKSYLYELRVIEAYHP